MVVKTSFLGSVSEPCMPKDTGDGGRTDGEGEGGTTDAVIDHMLVAGVVVDVDGYVAEGGYLGGELGEAAAVLSVGGGLEGFPGAWLKGDREGGDPCSSRL